MAARREPDLPRDEVQDLRAQIAELLSAYRKLKEWHDLCEAFFQQNPVAFSIKTAGPDGRYELLNARWEEAFGKKISEVVGKADRELWSAEIAEQLENTDRKVLETGAPVEATISMPRGEGARDWLSWRFPVRERSGNLFLGGASVDVTAFRPARHYAARLEHRLLCESPRHLIGILYGERERIAEANDVFLEMAGYTREELAGMKLEALIAPERHLATEEITRELEIAGVSSLKEVDLLRKDGTRMPAGIGFGLIEKAPRPTWVAYVVDMAEQQRVERRQRRAEAWESLGLIAAGVAHDFNNLLVVIVGNASMVAADEECPARCRAHIGEVLSAAEQAAALVRQLLAYSGKARITPSTLQVEELAREVCDAEPVPAGVRLEVNLPGNLPPISADPVQLREAIRSVVVNAIEAVGEKGAVRVNAGVVQLAEPYALPDAELPSGEYVSVSVEDSGPGIEEQMQARIFDPFFTTKFQGRGLGLAAAYGIVRRHGGAIRVESRAAEGTRFEILLPHHHPDPAAAA